MPRHVEAQVVVIGGGPAGMAAALSSFENGAEPVFLLERGKYLGGILNQCIHPGFGLHYFGEELTGPEYAEQFIERLKKTRVEVFLDTTVLEITKDRVVRAVNPAGVWEFRAENVVLSMGCRERTRGMLRIPGHRPAGIFTAGLAQYLVNIEGYLPGKEIVILGSGDIGLIMARRLTLEGACVKAVVEIKDSLSGLLRNYVQCLLDFDIPLLLSHTVTNILGKDRVEGVVVNKVNTHGQIIPEGEQFIGCDTLLLSVGLIPENDLSKKAGIPLCPFTGGPFVDEYFACDLEGFFACGNVAAVFDLVDYVTMVSTMVGGKIGSPSLDRKPPRHMLVPASGVSQVIPQRIREGKEGFLFIRSQHAFRDAVLSLSLEGREFQAMRIPLCYPSEMVKVNLQDIQWPSEKGEVQISIRGKRIHGVG
ncbi:MAG: FAD-dependent oxidoreductase [Candidatus Atribacteria bacterium]|nr:FAD-dependent oxidoreductase [Candidatus Atribacteria bacterium]